MRIFNAQTWAIAFAFVLPLAAVAAPHGDDYVALMKGMEGQWQGQGSMRDYTTGQSNSFNIAMTVQNRGDDKTWDAFVEKGSQSGGSTRNQVTYSIMGQFLLINSDEVMGGSATVDSADAKELSYTITEFDFGAIIDHRYRIQISDKSMRGTLEVQRNGMTTYTEDYSASRSQ